MTIMQTSLRSTGVLGAICILAACGGGGTAIIEDVPFNDPSSQETAALAGASLDSLARSSSVETGTLNRAADTASLGDLSGTINADRSLITLDGGGTVTLDPSDQTYSALFDASPLNGDRTIGVIGAVTDLEGLPTGLATYTGTTQLTIQDGVTVYDLTGDAAITANFATGSVRTTLDGLSGTQSNGITATTQATDVATITIDGSDITDATFSDGDVTVSSTTLSALSTSAATSVSGAFFGSGADEVGGVLAVDDTASGTVSILGDFIAK